MLDLENDRCISFGISYGNILFKFMAHISWKLFIEFIEGKSVEYCWIYELGYLYYICHLAYFMLGTDPKIICMWPTRMDPTACSTETSHNVSWCSTKINNIHRTNGIFHTKHLLQPLCLKISIHVLVYGYLRFSLCKVDTDRSSSS